jgi:DNA-binding transcriptional ArsR family regulator
MSKADKFPCCQPRPALVRRPLLSSEESNDLADVFSVLANDTRLRLLHALVRSRELSVSEIAEAVEMKPQAVSNQLQRLSDLGVVESRRDGNSMYYRLVDSCVLGLLDTGLCLMEESRRRKP